MKPTKILTSKNGLIVVRLYGPTDEARVAREQAISNHREGQLYGR